METYLQLKNGPERRACCRLAKHYAALMFYWTRFACDPKLDSINARHISSEIGSNRKLQQQSSPVNADVPRGGHTFERNHSIYVEPTFFFVPLGGC